MEVADQSLIQRQHEPGVLCNPAHPPFVLGFTSLEANTQVV